MYGGVSYASTPLAATRSFEFVCFPPASWFIEAAVIFATAAAVAWQTAADAGFQTSATPSWYNRADEDWNC